MDEDSTDNLEENQHQVQKSSDEIEPPSVDQPETETQDQGNDEEVAPQPELPDIRSRTTLLELDSRHSWLQILEEKCRSLEDAFVSKIQYVAISNHCQELLDELEGDEGSARLRAEYANLFDKFQTAFVGSQRLLNKLNETKVRKKMVEGENRKIKIRLEDRESKIEDLEAQLEHRQSEVLKLEQEVLALKDSVGGQGGSDDELEQQDSEDKLDQYESEADAAIRKLGEANTLLEHKLDMARQKEADLKNKLKKVYAENNSLKKELAAMTQQLQDQKTKAKKAELVVANKLSEIESKQETMRGLTEKVKQLEDELGQTEGDRSRWQLMQKVDPDRTDLIIKLASTQKQLFRATAELQRKELRAQESERLAQELRDKLKRQTDPADKREELWACKKELGLKLERVKILTAENSMFQNLCSKYEKEIMALRDRMRKYKIAEERGKGPRRSG